MSVFAKALISVHASSPGVFEHNGGTPVHNFALFRSDVLMELDSTSCFVQVLSDLYVF